MILLSQTNVLFENLQKERKKANERLCLFQLRREAEREIEAAERIKKDVRRMREAAYR